MLLLLGSILVSAAVGAVGIPLPDIWNSVLHRLGLGGAALPGAGESIIWSLRLPRAMTAAAVGAGLAISGVVMQALTRNSLADPYLLGLSSGGSLGAVAVLLLGSSLLLPVAAFVGAMCALLLTLALARTSNGLSTSRTVLAGIAVSALASSLTSFVIFWTARGDSYREILGWLMGSLGGATWTTVWIAGVTLLLVGVPLSLAGGQLDGFAFGETAAASLGINVTSTKWLMLTGTALLTGGMVAVSGSIGFVGLILPHVVRLLVGVRHKLLLPLAGLTGGIFLVWTDTLARTILAPVEIPVGIITALLGAPIFALLLMRKGAAS